MKISLSEIPEGLIQVTKIIDNESIVLVIPDHIGYKWTKDTLHFRSSMWNSKGELISASYPKFFNFEEAPDIYHKPSLNEKINVLEKLDGSTLIISRYNGRTIIRTRGSFDTNDMECAHEIETFKQRYSDFFELLEKEDTRKYSYIFEWISPDNKIVVPYEKSELVLTNIINHEDYSLMTQSNLDLFAPLWGFSRPRVFKFKSIEELLSYTDADLKAIGINDPIFEGWCVYYNNDQYIRKVKTKSYLVCHKFRENCDIETVLDIFIENKFTTYNELYMFIHDNYDYECAQMAMPEISKICESTKEVNSIINHMRNFVEKIKTYATRKEQAIAITQAYGITNRSGYVFNMLDGKSIDKEGLKKLYFQVLKK